MMNRFIYLFLLLGCAASALVGCTDDPEVEPLPTTGDGTPSWVTIDFCDNSFDKVNITTRATLDNVAESRVLNLFVFIFDSDGERLYGRFFDHNNRKDSKYQLLDSKEDCWWVAENATEATPHGKVRFYAPAASGCSLYILANVNADMVNISPDKLRFVQTLSDLQTMTATLNQEITERNGFFPMTGSASSITVSDGKITIPYSDENPNGKIMLKRLDAKIKVRVRVAKGYKGFTKSTVAVGDTGSTELDENGKPIPPKTEEVTTTHIIDSLVPLSWQVVNMPRTAFVLPDPNGADAPTTMFTTRETKFETRKPETFSYIQEKINDQTHEYVKDANGKIETETKEVTADVHGFSFYMLENRAAAKGNVPTTKPDSTNSDDKERLNEAWGYHARDTRLKDDGVYRPDPTGKGDIWKYAPAEGTYLVIKGEVVMGLDLTNEGKNQQLSADVVYYIHLGDFGKNLNDYNVERNTSYTYTITIYGVDNIQVEVEKEVEENESGATGHVYVAKEQIFTFDSHYGRAIVSFDAGHMTDIENLSWYVRTPFGREGRPHKIGGIEVPAGLDYQWVHFRVNERDNEGNYLRTTHAKYHPDKVMNILEFSKYIKEQKTKYDKFIEGKGTVPNESDFRPEEDKDWKKKFPNDKSVWTRYRIYVTIFVDEFYYDENPITGDTRQDLWKDFVNKPNRLMHILCDSDESKDEASRTTGSVVTIRQRSIQTVFNTEKPELKTAWGCETIDETRDVLWYFTRKEKFEDSNTGHVVIPDDAKVGVGDDGNNSAGNGLFNTARIWELVTTNWTTGVSKYNAKLWSDYVDFDRPYALRDKDNTETLRYSCMTRNRDENGDNIIDAKEVKWYLAAISQLTSLYVGDQGLSSEAVLYPYYKQAITHKGTDSKTGAFMWRAHVVSSTVFSDKCPEVLWAEEGLSTGSYQQAWGKYAGFTVRCVRNLGMEPSSEEDAKAKLMDTDDSHNMPEKAVIVSGPGIDNNEAVSLESVYKFDMSNLNPLSIRYYSSQELEPSNEYAVESRVYWAFETGPVSDKTYTYDTLYNLLRDGKSPCPEGYRAPNVREGALMSMRCPSWWPVTDSDRNYGRVTTYYSHGIPPLGTNQDPGLYNNSMSWVFNTERVNLDEGNDVKIRCVRDIRQ